MEKLFRFSDCFIQLGVQNECVWGVEINNWETTLKTIIETSLVVQWLRIFLPMQGSWVQFPVWEDPTYLKVTEPMCNNHQACTLELVYCSEKIISLTGTRKSPHAANTYIYIYIKLNLKKAIINPRDKPMYLWALYLW